MKQILIICFLLLTCASYSQKWQLCNINKKSSYKYEYCYQFEHLDDSCTYILTKEKGNLKSIIHLKDNVGDTLPGATVRITNLKNDSVINVSTNIDGNVQSQFGQGKYKIEIFYANFDDFSLTIDLSEHEFFNLDAKLGLGPELRVFQINSKHKLTEQEIFKIMDCVKRNNRNLHLDCEDRTRFYITIQI